MYPSCYRLMKDVTAPEKRFSPEKKICATRCREKGAMEYSET